MPMKLGTKMVEAKTVAMSARYMVFLLWRARPDTAGIAALYSFDEQLCKWFIFSAGGYEI
jgi:hypothetical protein